MSIKKLLLLFAAVTPAALFAFSGEGVGTEKYPYLIKTADELFEIRNDLSANYKIMEDIDLSEFIQEESPSKGWAPIGNATTPFTGTLDGNNKTIKGLYINRPETDNIGLFGCIIAPATVKNLAIANANITGANYTGTLFGACLMGLLESNTAGCDIKDIVILDTNVVGKTGVGGIVGGIIFPENFSYYYNAAVNIRGCWVSGSISGGSSVGGICGHATSGQFSTGGYSSGNNFDVNISNNYSRADIVANLTAGGILGTMTYTYRLIGYSHWTYLSCEISQNIVRGTIKGYGANGIIGRVSVYNNKGYDSDWIRKLIISNNVAAPESITNTDGKEVYRISNRPAPNNYAWNGTVCYGGSSILPIDDDDCNGTSYGLKTLNKKATYEGFGFDFSSQWAIKDNQSFPYNINQTEIPEVTKFYGGSRAYIEGKGKNLGHVMVVVNGVLHESYIVDGKWRIDLGNVPVGTSATVSVTSSDKMPSPSVYAIATDPSAEPLVTPGDANSDGAIDAADVVATINYILGNPSQAFNFSNADVTGDGQVLVDDAVEIINLIMSNQ